MDDHSERQDLAAELQDSADPAQERAERPPRVGFVVGPTGVGKTPFAIGLAERLGAEIVNADSRQLYRGMDIGTAKPTPEERSRVTHHLLDIADPDRPLDVVQFQALAEAAITAIVERGKRALVVGGSGLYLRVLRGGIFEGPAASKKLRAKLEAIAAEKGVAHLHERLRAVDAESAERIAPADLKRIVRAIEVYELTGTPISAHHRRHHFQGGAYETMTVGLTLPRERLYAAINHRVDLMVQAGLVEEVRGLLAKGYQVDAPPLQAIGYKEIAAYLRGEIELADAIEMAKRQTRRLAKRQLTWFRGERGVVWVDAQHGMREAMLLFEDFFVSGHAGTDA
jgi:tRNA dimethylallyltransferase